MSAPINDGGPAFPNPEIETEVRDEHGVLKAVEVSFATRGMTLRDYFAAAALQGLIASHRPGDDWPSNSARRQGVEPQHVIAAAAYDFADAMLKQREAQS